MVYLYFVLSIGLGLLYFCTFNTYKKGWLELGTNAPTQIDSTDTVTVVVASRNEEKGIANLMASLSKQQYPDANFDIILVDDHSEDSTIELLQSLDLDNLKIVRQEVGRSGKKEALNTAIKLATGKYILFTDADCEMEPLWITSMVEKLKSSDSHMVAGPVYIENDDTFINQYQAIDLSGLIVVTKGAIDTKAHAMANGANMAVVANKIPRFDLLKGSSKASGDDMFLAQYFLELDKLIFNKDTRAWVKTKPENTWSAILRQRRRWSSKNALLTGFKTKANFSIIIGFYINLFISFFSYFWIGAAGIAVFVISLCIKIAADNIILKEGATYFNLKYNELFLLKAQPVQIWLTLSAFFSAIFQVPFDWKGRNYK